MRTEPPRIPKASSWPKSVVRKWLNLQNPELMYSGRNRKSGEMLRRMSCPDKDSSVTLMRRNLLSGGWLVESSDNLKDPQSQGKRLPAGSSLAIANLRVFVGTWNVGGRPPHAKLNLKDWLVSTPNSSAAAADIYVLGFQEIVPLNAGNVLGPEDSGPAQRWLALIHGTLNSDKKAAAFSSATVRPKVSFSDLISIEVEQAAVGLRRSDYCLAASKQMVAIFLCVWVRAGLLHGISSLKVSCVGRGIMGYMGNKGSISMSMTLHGASFCFVCTHLASGEKDGDEVRRNSDVMEIMKRTKFLPSHRIAAAAAAAYAESPETILKHDNIIWLGDLNYRLASTGSDTQQLLQNKDWHALLDKDQLRIEQRAGRVFAGWEEGRINFPPTYKYMANSDIYAGNPAKPRDKSRIPAWCDRILWRGKGMKQMWYLRGESQFSDHRPVYSLFSVKLDNQTTHAAGEDKNPRAAIDSGGGSSPSPSSWGRGQAEELFLVARTQSCLEASRF